MTENQVKALTLEERRQLYAESVKVLDGYVIPLTKISISLFGKVVPYKIYDRLDWAVEKPVMLEHWRSFAEKARMGRRIYVFNSCFLQSPLSETMMRLDFGISQTKAYIEEIYRIIAALSPVVIYLRCSNVRARVEEVSEQRTAVWLDSAVAYHTTQGYGRRNSLTGFDGYIACLEERQKRELEILDKLPVKKLTVTDPFNDWDRAHEAIGAFFAGKALQKA
ncbi:shikimate kinase [Sporobacter termitidis DSM 10068]|uniref:Shikimate kinase n=2 Tax=Sporobacter TaxID=44748 RepID=A0A1M5Y7C9_9FIRM|nr:shikimate kinase [Sporobacter termitidis DSM 10068]